MDPPTEHATPKRGFGVCWTHRGGRRAPSVNCWKYFWIRWRRRAQLAHALSLLSALDSADNGLDQRKPFFMVLVAPLRVKQARGEDVHCKPPQTP